MPATLEARPAVFIGLGGAGSSVVSYLKKTFLNHFGAGNTELNKLQFIALDTSRPDYEKLQREFGDTVLRENDEWFSLGQFNPYREYQEYKVAIKAGRTISSYESLKQWLDERAASRFFDRRIEDGASADRQQGRLCFWKKSDDFEVMLTQKIKRAYDLITAMQRGSGASTPALEVYVISGTCGGTGSSCFLDVCYAVNRIYQSPTIGAHEEPRVRGVLFLPFRYIAMQKEAGAPESTVHRYQANGYGFFEEIEYLLWDKFLRGELERRGKAFHRLSVKSEDTAIRSLDFSFRPFQMALLVDDKTDQNETIRDRDLYPNTAKALFHMFLSSATDSIDSAYNNVETNLQNLNPQTLKFGSVPAYATFGYRSVEYPRDQLMRYFRDRF
ncbi:MAG TPA: tubulin-like doman-containing protein, partial [Blastocatellia bacterium]|nr:tubulin-like doman-containing protein [Blastocatellia bacterium]